jgi:putative endonuclease
LPGCYILYSATLNCFYIGAVHDSLETRLKKHRDRFYGNSHFTAQADDWELYMFIECDSFSQAIRIERHIKRMKSCVFIENLVQYPEMVERLKLKYKST